MSQSKAIASRLPLAASPEIITCAPYVYQRVCVLCAYKGYYKSIDNERLIVYLRAKWFVQALRAILRIILCDAVLKMIRLRASKFIA